MKDRVLMFVGAHPDDETFGPGATLAAYAAAGARVVYVCATRGEAGSARARDLRRCSNLADLRSRELACAARRLGLATVAYLGYRDSGMPGTPDQGHPRALVRATLEQVGKDVLAAVDEHRPQVIVTFDALGAYGHADHVAIHRATSEAFRAAREGPGGPQRLYYWIPRRDRLRQLVRVLRLLGRDPSRMGRHRDVDLASMAAVDFPVHARIAVPRSAVARRHAALACHRSQLDGPLPLRRLVWLLSRRATYETFMRAHPEPLAGEPLETDLFGRAP